MLPVAKHCILMTARGLQVSAKEAFFMGTNKRHAHSAREHYLNQAKASVKHKLPYLELLDGSVSCSCPVGCIFVLSFCVYARQSF